MTTVMTEKRHRLQFAFAPDAYNRLVQIKKQAHAATFAEVVRKALSLYEWFVEQEQEGYEIALLKDGKPVKAVKLVL